MRHHPLHVLSLALAVSLFALSLVSPASAATTVITLSIVVGPPTTRLKVSGQGFGPSEAVSLEFDAHPVGVTLTDPAGAFSASIRVPAAASPGNHTVEATGQTSGQSASAPFLVRVDWPKFEFDPGNTGFNPFENVLSPSNVSSLHLLWRISTGQRPESPSVANGLVYFGDNNGVMHAVDSSTGSTVWDRPWHGLGYSAPLILGHRLYVRQASIFLLAFDALTGRVHWQSSMGGAGTPAAPTASYGLLFQGS